MIFDCRPDVRLRPSVSERVNDVTVNGARKRIVKMREERREMFGGTYDPEGSLRALTSIEYTSSARQEEGQSWRS